MNDVTTPAHEAAYRVCHILHRDISPSNILISRDNPDGGLLIDWDLCKDVNLTERKARRAARMVRIKHLLIYIAVLLNWNQGTWQFMAADLIADHKISQAPVHDLESAFYVMFWLSLKYLPSSYPPSRRGMVLKQVFNPDSPGSLFNHAPSSTPQARTTAVKVDWMANSEDVQQFKVTGNNPLSSLLSSLKDILGVRHLSENRARGIFRAVGINEADWEKKMAELRTVGYPQVLDTLNAALTEQWPVDDSAQLQEIILPRTPQLSALSGSK